MGDRVASFRTRMRILQANTVLHKTLGLGRVTYLSNAPYKVLVGRTRNPFTSRRPPYAETFNRRCLFTISDAWILLDPSSCPLPVDGERTGCAKSTLKCDRCQHGRPSRGPPGVCQTWGKHVRPLAEPRLQRAGALQARKAGRCFVERPLTSSKFSNSLDLRSSPANGEPGSLLLHASIA